MTKLNEFTSSTVRVCENNLYAVFIFGPVWSFRDDSHKDLNFSTDLLKRKVLDLR